MKAVPLKAKKSYLYYCLSLALSSMTVPVLAEEPGEEEEGETIVVIGAPVLRDRTSSVAPELEYSVEFFQRFEPTSAGDMLKRTPGISFTSDIGEYDAPQMRGLGEGYTQVLINGRKIPGSGSDRAVFVDRIPAEMVESIQIVRSPSADQDSQGVGGTINIILKEGASFDGGSLRLGTFRSDDNELRKSAAFAYGGQSNNLSWTASANFQERYVPKLKIEETFDPQSGDRLTSEIENDVRDSDDISASASIEYQIDNTSILSFSANLVSTSREEYQTEEVSEVDDGGTLVLDELARDDVDIEEDSFSFSTIYSKEFGDSNEWETSLSFSRITELEDVIKYERDSYDDVEEFDAIEQEDTTDKEVYFGSKISFELESETVLKVGLDTSLKTRDESYTEFEVDGDSGAIEGIDLLQTYDVEEQRIDGFLLGEFNFDNDMTLELGVRVEHTSREIENEVASDSTSTTQINPSAHYSWKIDRSNTFRMSLAKTVRRPGFKQLSPTIEFDEPEDGDAKQGNPLLEDETSIGLDLGFEHSFEDQGILGVNAFYRDVTDVIEESSSQLPSGGTLFTYDNKGDGSVWGLEMDVNKRLGEDTAFFANVTLLDSEIIDQFTGKERKFRNQSDYIYNFGVTHNIPSWDSGMGFSYQKQGDSLSVDIHRDVELEYEANLELYFEKRFGDEYVLRLTATNLLDAHKIERFKNYEGDSAEEILANHVSGNVGELEVEDEQASRLFTLTFRASF